MVVETQRDGNDQENTTFHASNGLRYDYKYTANMNDDELFHRKFVVPTVGMTGGTNLTNSIPSLEDYFDLPLLDYLSIVEESEPVTNGSGMTLDNDVGNATSTAEGTTESAGTDTCHPMAEWMTASFVNCNSIHEIDLPGGTMQQDDTDLMLLGQGWFRSAWRYSAGMDNGSGMDGSSPPLILKSLRIEREFLEEYYELHRRDAVAMERLTSSPFVMDVYGYCGQSALNEFAEGILDGQVSSLEQLNRRMRGRESDENTLRLKLQLATSIAIGLAHVHNVHIATSSSIPSVKELLNDSQDNETISTTGFGNSVATMAHYDINPRNIAIMRNGKPKLNDFNIAEFLHYRIDDNNSTVPCGFRSRLHEPWWRAPEEMDMSHTFMATEKVDVYALGNVLFHILTTHSPRGKMKKERMEEVRTLVRAGERPKMLEPFVSDPNLKRHRIVKAFLKAMDLCFEMEPAKRGSSIDVARVLHKALQREKERDESSIKEEKRATKTDVDVTPKQETADKKEEAKPRNDKKETKAKPSTSSTTTTKKAKKLSSEALTTKAMKEDADERVLKNRKGTKK